MSIGQRCLAGIAGALLLASPSLEARCDDKVSIALGPLTVGNFSGGFTYEVAANFTSRSTKTCGVTLLPFVVGFSTTYGNASQSWTVPLRRAQLTGLAGDQDIAYFPCEQGQYNLTVTYVSDNFCVGR